MNAATEESQRKLPRKTGNLGPIITQIGVEIYGDFIRRIIIANVQAVLAGSVKPNTTGPTAHVWELDGTRNATYTLFVGTDFAIVLFGFWGNF